MKQISIYFLAISFIILLFSGCNVAQKTSHGAENAGINNATVFQPLKNGWPELKTGSNGLVPRFVPPKPGKISIDINTSIAGLFIVKFIEGSHIRFKNDELFFDDKNALNNTEEMSRLARVGLKADGVVSQLQSVKKILSNGKLNYGFNTWPMFRTPEQPYEKDDQFIEKAELEQRAGEELADLDLYYVVYAKDFKDIYAEENLLNELNNFGIIEQVYPAVFSRGASINSISTNAVANTPPTPDITSSQGYLDAAPTGLDARFAWTRGGGLGDGIKVVDVEYGWVLNHEDFPMNFVLSGRPPLIPYVREGSEHGTAVLGILASPHNGFGVSGFVPNISYGLSTAVRPGYIAGAIIATFSGENWVGRCHNVAVAVAILDAIAALLPGNVLLIEQHTPGPSTGVTCSGCDQWEYVPMEYYQECFDVIRRATAAGMIVVEAGGNGSQDLDGIVYGDRFNPHTRNSQAILVGASGMGDRVRASFSNTSRRIDVHAWGSGIVSLGYGDGTMDPFNTTDAQRLYTNRFGGTSGASPMVAGAIASIQGVRRNAGQLLLSPVDMRNLLVETGTPQISGGPIGPQPNLRDAITRSTGTSGFSGPGIYTIRSKFSGKVLDIDVSLFRGGNDGQRLEQWDAHTGLNQQFRIEDIGHGSFRLIALHSSKALAVSGVSTAEDAEIRQYTPANATNQAFSIEQVGSTNFFKIVSISSRKVLDIRGPDRNNGAQIIQRTNDSSSNSQQWEFIRLR
jgi:hypothetical protein